MWKWTLTDADGTEHIETTDNAHLLCDWILEADQAAQDGAVDNIVIEWLGEDR